MGSSNGDDEMSGMELEDVDRGLSELSETLEEIDQERSPKEKKYYSRYRDIMEEHIDILKNHNDFVNQQMDLMKDVSEKYNMLVQGFHSDIIDLAEDYQDLLDELSDKKKRRSYLEAIGGFGLLDVGFLSAWVYSAGMETNIVDYYSNAPANYSAEPEAAFWTLGVPLAGFYLFKKAYDDRKKYKELEERSEEVDEMLNNFSR